MRLLGAVLFLCTLAAGPALPATAAETAASAAPAAPGERPRITGTPSARELIASAIDLTRGATSYSELEMRIHRPDWSRSTTLVAWTRGREDALIRFTEPPKDAGNATLKQGEQMWTFTPRLNRVVRLPYSMMSQSWAGSDFSYNDLSRTDNLLRHYEHAIIETREEDGHVLYLIESIPHANAPVVWGRETMLLRDDYVLLEQTFFDQDGEPLKRMYAQEIGELGGRTFAVRMRMVKLDEDDHYTELHYHEAEFDLAIPDSRFTLYALRNPER